jgi:flagellum-specific ATP synthase
MRVRAATVACSVAEHFRDEGKDVLLMLDSITRFAQAQRQIGLSAGEAPATKGFTPSVFAMLPRLLERAGTIAGGGSITGFYTVLVEGDDMTEPIADAAKGILDGHIVLSRKIAERAHFPAIDILQSISRVADQISDSNHLNARRHVSRLLASYREAEELIQIGAYAKGSNPDVDAAIAVRPAIQAFLQQDRNERAEYPRTLRSLIELSLAATNATSRRAGAAQAGAQGASTAGQAAQTAGAASSGGRRT